MLFNLSAHHGAIMVQWDSKRQQYVCGVKDRRWFGDTQIEAMTAAWNDLEARPKTDT